MHTGKPECHLVHNLLKSLIMKIPISTESALLSERTDAPFPLGLASPCSLRHFSGPMMMKGLKTKHFGELLKEMKILTVCLGRFRRVSWLEDRVKTNK